MYTVTYYKLRKKDVYITFNDIEMTIPLEVFYKYHIKVGQTFDAQTYQELINDARYYMCKDAAYRALKTPKTTYEMKQKLASFPDNIVKQIISELKDKKYLDDTQYMHLYTELRPGIGPKKLEQVFKDKGIEFSLVDTFLSHHDFSYAQTYAFEKARRTIKGESLQKTKEKLTKKLLAKGFTYAQIKPFAENIIVSKDEETEAIEKLFDKTISKLSGPSYEKCQRWLKKAMSKGFSYELSKQYCERMNDENI